MDNWFDRVEEFVVSEVDTQLAFSWPTFRCCDVYLVVHYFESAWRTTPRPTSN